MKIRVSRNLQANTRGLAQNLQANTRGLAQLKGKTREKHKFFCTCGDCRDTVMPLLVNARTDRLAKHVGLAGEKNFAVLCERARKDLNSRYVM